MPGSEKFHRCVDKVDTKGGKYNKYAVCHASLDEEVKEADYPWGQCQSDQAKAGHDKDSANKICGSIKAANETIEETIMKQVLETKLKGCGCQKKKKPS